MMMAVVVVAAELLLPVPPPPDVVVPEECVDTAVAVLTEVALLMPLPLATDESCGPAADCCPDPDCCPESLPPVRSSFMARLASSVSVAAVVAVVLDSGEVGEVVVELGDFSGAAIVGMSRSMDFWLTALCDSVERLSQICLVGSISIIETMVCQGDTGTTTFGKVTSPRLAGNDGETCDDDR